MEVIDIIGHLHVCRALAQLPFTCKFKASNEILTCETKVGTLLNSDLLFDNFK